MSKLMKHKDPLNLWRLHGGAKLLGVLYHEDQDLKSLSAELEALIDQHKVKGLVVGYPFSNQQEKSDYGLKTARFINNLSNSLNFGGINFTYWDKTITPKEITIENHVELGMNRLVYDDFLLEPLVQHQRCAPHLILQGYLHSGVFVSWCHCQGLGSLKTPDVV
ncbi:hypothetical protein QYF36_011253 [Acer negundo]|nr:hypothetical protein QYF36_011253 [Acer negundo]